jgi:hypothetical protein
MKKRGNLTLYPIFMALYPGIALLANNRTQVKLHVGFRSMGVSLLLGLLVWLITWLILKNRDKSALLSTLILILAFSYGHVYAMLKHITLFGILIGRHRYLAPAWAVLLIVGASLILGRLRKPERFTPALNWILGLAIALPVAQIAIFTIRINLRSGYADTYPESVGDVKLIPPSEGLPDIYYIIMDGYTRADTLSEVFSYDNSPFLDRLREMGFYVADCSQSNYAQTELSLASSLNLNYLDALGDEFVASSTDRSPLWSFIEHSMTRDLLEEMGYKVVAFETGYYWTQLEDADVYFRPDMSTVESLRAFGGLSDFEVMFFKSSIGLLIADGVMVLPTVFQPDLDYPDKIHRERVLFTLSELEAIPKIPGPKFAFVHVVAPHFPYVFGPNGEQVTPIHSDNPQDRQANNIKGYRDQVIFVNNQLERILERIIRDSSIAPVIVIQGDHGPGLVPDSIFAMHRMNILNVYLLPAPEESELYASITPVNSFRVVFNHVFGADFELLEDVSRLSSYENPYQYTIVENLCTTER